LKNLDPDGTRPVAELRTILQDMKDQYLALARRAKASSQPNTSQHKASSGKKLVMNPIPDPDPNHLI
jgi:hypothetical protein